MKKVEEFLSSLEMNGECPELPAEPSPVRTEAAYSYAQ